MRAAVPSPVAGEVPADVVVESRAVLVRHARSFRWGAALLPAENRDDAAVVYAFCRLVDDLADERPEPTEVGRREAAEVALADLEAELDGAAAARPLVLAFQQVCLRRGIPPQAARHLVEGVRSDIGAVRLPDDGALQQYGYRVAGTVGLMMCGVLGVRDPRAVPHAIDLGIAMQITNICRDVLEDARRGRTYLPADRLAEAGVSPEQLIAGADRPDDSLRRGVSSVVRDLLAVAERYYDSGFAGLEFIPARPRLGIRVAATLYRAIGRRLMVNRDGDPLDGRTFVGWTSKSVLALGALAASLFSTPRQSPHDPALHRHLAGLPGAAAR